MGRSNEDWIWPRVGRWRPNVFFAQSILSPPPERIPLDLLIHHTVSEVTYSEDEKMEEQSHLVNDHPFAGGNRQGTLLLSFPLYNHKVKLRIRF